MPKPESGRAARETGPAPQRAKAAEVQPASSASLLHLAPGAIVQRAAAAPQTLRPAELISMQRTIGNRAMGAMLDGAGVQAKLIVNAPDDRYEREADRVAEQVMRMPVVPREATPAPHDPPQVMTKPAPGPGGAGSFAAGEDFSHHLDASRGRGRPLPPALRETFEGRFGADFSAVRIHSGDQAAQLSQAIQAQAFTRGPDIFLGAGHSTPDSMSGQRLLAHELTHVIQQGAAPPTTAATQQPVAQSGPVSGTVAGQIQRMLDWQDTKWDAATEVRVTKGGAGGALFVKDQSDAPPVVLKSDEEGPEETKLFAALHHRNKKRERNKLGGWGIVAAGVRFVDDDECKDIKRYLVKEKIRVDNWDPADAEKGREKALKIISKTTALGTMVYQFSHGEDFSGLTQDSKSLSDSEIGRRVTHLVTLFQDRGFVTALGVMAVIDIFTGNFDRLVEAYNAENFKVDYEGKKIGAMDNVADRPPGGVASYMFKRPSERADVYWSERPYTLWLKRGEYGAIASNIFENIEANFLLAKWYNGISYNEVTIQDALKNPNFRKWLTKGISLSKNSLEDLHEKSAKYFDKDVMRSFRNRLDYITNSTLPWQPLRTSSQQQDLSRQEMESKYLSSDKELKSFKSGYDLRAKRKMKPVLDSSLQDMREDKELAPPGISVPETPLGRLTPRPGKRYRSPRAELLATAETTDDEAPDAQLSTPIEQLPSLPPPPQHFAVDETLPRPIYGNEALDNIRKDITTISGMSIYANEQRVGFKNLVALMDYNILSDMKYLEVRDAIVYHRGSSGTSLLRTLCNIVEGLNSGQLEPADVEQLLASEPALQ